MDVTSLAFGDIDEDDEEGSGALAFLNAPVMTIRQVLQLQVREKFHNLNFLACKRTLPLLK